MRLGWLETQSKSGIYRQSIAFLISASIIISNTVGSPAYILPSIPTPKVLYSTVPKCSTLHFVRFHSRFYTFYPLLRPSKPKILCILQRGWRATALERHEKDCCGSSKSYSRWRPWKRKRRDVLVFFPGRKAKFWFEACRAKAKGDEKTTFRFQKNS